MPVNNQAALQRALLLRQMQPDAQAYPMGAMPGAQLMSPAAMAAQPPAPPPVPVPQVPQAPPNIQNQVQAARALRSGPPAPPPPQSGLALNQGPSINTGLGAGDEAYVRGYEPAKEQFAQGERAGGIADEMRRASMEEVSGRMVGNIYVPASITQYGAKVIEAFVAVKKEKEQKELRGEAAKDVGKMRWGWLKGLDTEDRAKAMGLLAEEGN